MKMKTQAQRIVAIVCLLSMLLSSIPAPLLAQAPAAEQPSQPPPTGAPLLPGPSGVTINLATGNLHYQLPAHPMLHSLHYNALLHAETRDLGPGWRFGYDIAYHETPDGDVAILWGDGHRSHFERRSDGSYRPAEADRAPAGTHKTLTRIGAPGYRLTTPEGETLIFDDAGHTRVTRIESPDGRALSFAYDANGHLTAVHAPYDRVIHLHYDANGRITGIVEDANTLTLTYDANSQLSTVADANGDTTTYAYEQGRLTKATSPDGREVAFSYRRGDGRITDIGGDEGAWSFIYDANGAYTDVYRTVAGQTQTTRYRLDARERLASIQALGGAAHLTWDADDHLVRGIDPAGNATHFTYNADGNVTAAANPLGNTARATYLSGTRLPSSQTDPLGRVWSYIYNNQQMKQIEQIIHPNGSAFHFAYEDDSAGVSRLTAITDPLGGTYRAAYDAQGRRASETSPEGLTLHLSYEDGAHPTQIRYPDLATYTLVYDAAGQLTSVGPEGEPALRTTYDADGNVAARIAPSDAAWRYVADSTGHLTDLRDPLGNLTQLAWRGDHPAAMTVPGGATTSFTWEYDRLIAREDPLARETTFAYDARGALTRAAYADAATLTYRRDAAGQITQTVASPGADASYIYDAAGQIIRAENEDVLVEKSYGPTGQPGLNIQPIAITVTHQATGQSYTLGYEYDAMGRRTALIDPQGERTTYGYDADGRLTRITAPGGDATAFAYDARDRLIRRTEPSGVALTLTYNAWDLPTEIRYAQGETVLFEQRITYNADGHPIRIEELGEATAALTQTAQYDPLGRLLHAQTSDGREWIYTYDARGNRRSLNTEQDVITYTYDAADQLQATSLEKFTHDARGNLINRTTSADGETTRAYAWDAYNRLVAAEQGADATSIAHYPHGLPLSYDDTVLHLYDDENNAPLLDIDAASGEVLARYLRHPQVAGGRAWQAMHSADAAYTYVTDHEGSVRALLDANGDVIAHYRYAPFGTLLEHTEGAVENPLRYQGRRWQDDLALYEEGARYYDPTLGRYIGRDEEAGALPNVEATNPYAPTPRWPIVDFDPMRPHSFDHLRAQAQSGPDLNARPGAWLAAYLPPAQAIGYDEAAAQTTLASEDLAAPGAGHDTPHRALPKWWAGVTSETPAYVHSPRVALLENGHVAGAAALLRELGFSYTLLPPDFAPGEAAATPVLLIPTGGLFGLADVASVRDRLAAYVEQGGALIVAAQQHSADLAALPGDLAGLGWRDDPGGYHATAVIADAHPALAGFNRPTMTLFLDGALQPPAAPGVASLLVREKQGGDAATIATHGEGYVIATALTSDWGQTRAQIGAEDRQLWRGLLNWGALRANQLASESFAPGDEVYLPLRVQNTTEHAISRLRLTLRAPDGSVAASHIVSTSGTINPLPLNLAPGATITVPYTTTARMPVGLWRVDYTLMSAGDPDLGVALQLPAIGGAFVVADPPPHLAADRAWDFWITTADDKSTWARGDVGSFTLHLRNRTDQPSGDVEIRYNFPRHAGETLTLDIGNVSAQEEITRVVDRALHTDDHLFATLYEDGAWQTFDTAAIDIVAPAARLGVEPASAAYYDGASDPMQATITLTDVAGADYNATLHLMTFDPDGARIDSEERSVALLADSAIAVDYTPTLPPTPTYGLYKLRAELRDPDGHVVGYGDAAFDAPAPDVTVALHRAAPYRLAEDNAVDFILTNGNATTVDDGVFHAELTAPDGARLWYTDTAFTLAGNDQLTLTYNLPLGADLGVYRLTYATRQRGEVIFRDQSEVAAAYAVSYQTDAATGSRYAPGETMGVTITVENIGEVETPLTTTLTAPDADDFAQSTRITPTVGATRAVTANIALSSMLHGAYPMTVTLTTAHGASSTHHSHYLALPPNLRLSMAQRRYRLDETLPLRVANLGAGSTGYIGLATLRDQTGARVLSEQLSDTIGSGATVTHALALPPDLKSGLYTLEATVNADSPEQQVKLRRIIAVDGVSSDLDAHTAQQVYADGGIISATAWLTNTGDFTLTNGTLTLKAQSMLGEGPTAGSVQAPDGQRLPGAYVTIDGEQSFWTNIDGEFRFVEIEPGDHSFQVERWGYEPYSATHTVAGPHQPITLTLAPRFSAHLSGAVRVSGGLTIVVGAEISLHATDAPTAEIQPAHQRTGGDGGYHFAHLAPGTYAITVTAPGFEALTTTMAISAGANSHNFTLTRQATPWYDDPFLQVRADHVTTQRPMPIMQANASERAPGLAAPYPRPEAIPLMDLVTEDITTNTTWIRDNSPYTLDTSIIVSPNVTLTIEPGVIIRTPGSRRLEIQGHLKAIGTSTQTITFTSQTDTSPGQWVGLKFVGGGTGELHHTVLRYAGGGSGGNPGILIQNSAGVAIRSSAILSNTNAGVEIKDSYAIISDTLIFRNQDGSRCGINGSFDATSIVTVQHTTFRDNVGPGLCLGADNWARASALTFISDTARIQAGTISRAMRLPTDWGAEFYELAGEVAVGSSIPLTIEPGIELRGRNNASLKVMGHLTAHGTPTRPITFTSTAPGIQQWRGILLDDGGSGDLAYVTISNAGQGPQLTPKGGIALNNQAHLTLQYGRILSNGHGSLAAAGIWVENSRATISRTLFAHNGVTTTQKNYALQIKAEKADTVVTITESTLRNTTGYALSLEKARDGVNASLIARHNRLFDNFQQAESNAESNVEVDARYNWWDAAPPTATLFSGPVITAPWIITETFEAGYFDLARDVHEPNDIFDQATLLGAINTGVAAFLDPAGDVDFYEVHVPESGNLVAVVDARGTSLAPEVTIYDVGGNEAPTIIDEAGAHITATAPADSETSYYVRIQGVGGLAQTSSRQPYRLTVLLADPNRDLIAQAQRHAGRTYPLGSRSVALTSRAATQVTTETNDISLAGGYYLLSELRNAHGQVIATARTPFFLSDSPLALTLNTDAPAYRPGETITITGEVHNTGDTEINQTLFLKKNGDAISSEPVSLGPGGTFPYQATTTAPEVGDAVTLTGEISGARVVAIFDIVTPTVAATLDAPQQTLPHPFVAQATLANNTAVPADLHIDFHGAHFTQTVAPGALEIFTRALQLTQTTNLSLTLTSDFTDTLTQTVALSAAPTFTLRADDPQREGDVVLPYDLENPGDVDLVAEVIFDLDDAVPFRRPQRASQLFGSSRPAARAQGIAWLTPHALDANGAQIRRTYLLPAGDRLDDTLIVSLTRGLRPLTMTLRLNPSDNPGLFDHSQGNIWQRAQTRTLTVQGENDLKLTASGAPTVTAVITNVGWNAISGTLVAQGQRAGQPFAREVRTLHLDKGDSADFTLPLDALHLAAGPYTVAVTLQAEDGALLAHRELHGRINPPDLALTHAPATTLFPAGETTLLTYTVHNLGGAPALAEFHLAWDALHHQNLRRWLPAGATADFTLPISVPFDMPTLAAPSAYTFGSADEVIAQGARIWRVAGLSLTVASGADRAAYLPGDPATLRLTITNHSALDLSDLTAHVAFGGEMPQRAFDLPAGQTTRISATFAADFTSNPIAFYGLYSRRYHRALAQGTQRLHRQTPGATIRLDQDRYRRNATANATLVTTLTQGTLTAYIFDQTFTRTLGSASGSSFDFAIPADATPGAHALTYAIHGSGTPADGRAATLWFDVDAPVARVIGQRVTHVPTTPDGIVSATLTLAADAAHEVEITSWLHTPDGQDGPASRQTLALRPGITNTAHITAALAAQMGFHQLRYTLTPASVTARRRADESATPAAADGAIGLDIGPAALLHLATDQPAYANAESSAHARIDIYTNGGGAANISLAMNGTTPAEHNVNLTPGHQTITLLLSSPLPIGHQQLTATLQMDGFSATAQTAFVCGAALPDLIPGLPMLTTSDGNAALQTVVVNAGGGASAETTVAFSDDGAAIDSVTLSALEAGETTLISVPWDTAGQGGPRTFEVTVAPVAEFDETNNTAAADYALPRFRSGLSVTPDHIGTGENTTLLLALRNLQTEDLPVTTRLEIRDPAGTPMLSHTLNTTLGNIAQTQTIQWLCPADALPGTYTAFAISTDTDSNHGEQRRASANFYVTSASGADAFDIYLPLVVRSTP